MPEMCVDIEHTTQIRLYHTYRIQKLIFLGFLYELTASYSDEHVEFLRNTNNQK